MVEEYIAFCEIWDKLKMHGEFRIPMICMLIDMVAADEGRDPAAIAKSICQAVIDCNNERGGAEDA